MKVFIGGFGGVGSRLLSQMFESTGMYVGKEHSNRMYDFLTDGFVRKFSESFKKNNYNILFDYMDAYLHEHEEFAIKHGHLMYCFNELSFMYDDCVNVYMMRNPIDAALKLEYIPHHNWGGLAIDDLEGKMQYYIDESVKAYEKADFVVKYEDLCFDTENEVKRINEFFELDIKVPDIIPSKSIGIGEAYYSKFDMSKLGY